MPTPFRQTPATMIFLPRQPHHSWYGNKSEQGEALIRARRPYLIKNAVGGFALLGLCMGIYFYTIKVIGQDNFDDVEVPVVPRKPTKTT